MRNAIAEVIVGQDEVVSEVLWGLLAGGHVLLEGNPGLGKTLLVRTLASCLDPANNSCLPEGAISWTCAPRANAGGACFTDVNCVDGLFCPNPDFNIEGATCTARKAVGASCSLPNECESLFCKGGKCVEATKQAAYCLSAD